MSPEIKNKTSATRMNARRIVRATPSTFGSLCLVLVVLASPTPSLADSKTGESYPRIWLNPGFFSLHFDRTRDLREDNIGLGAEIVLHRNHALIGGTFINSERERTRYAAYQWRPLHWKAGDTTRVVAGVVIAALDGYPRVRDGDWFVAPLPLLAIESRRIGFNFSVVPTINDRVDGAVIAQIKVRVW
ncbi:MAG TPA: hypothetical protein VNM24_04250 [Burkholderiales bacterium]|nr:hypothetical protein [Burkholderiales bacterium]